MELRHPATTSLDVAAAARDDWRHVLTPDAIAFVAELTRSFRPALAALLRARRERVDALRRGDRLDFLADTAGIRAAAWKVGTIPAPLQKRVVEITGPVDKKMIINALNSGADVFMADFEDATSPTFANLVEGQSNLMDAVRRTLTFTDAATHKSYALNPKTAVLLARPRGLHLPEKHLRVDGEPVPGALLDFGLYVFHNAKELLARGAGPWFYLPKLEHWLEAKWWNDVCFAAEAAIGIAPGSIKATVLIETLPAAFQMDEILHALKDHVVGLNCGRWDYIFSFIKCHRHDDAAVLPDRAQVTMEQPFLRAYTQLLVKTCHRRGAFAMGGMAAQIPIKSDAAANEKALERVRADKTREVKDGHDGTWVAHPGLVAIAREAFEAHMRGPNQLAVARDDVHVTADDLLRIPTGTRTETGLRANIRIGVRYLEAWLRGQGCVPLEHLMEDAATAEISRTQVWQQLRWNAALADGRSVDRAFVKRVLAEEVAAIAHEIGEERFAHGRFAEARALFADLCFADPLPEFLTLAAYDALDAPSAAAGSSSSSSTSQPGTSRGDRP